MAFIVKIFDNDAFPAVCNGEPLFVPAVDDHFYIGGSIGIEGTEGDIEPPAVENKRKSAAAPVQCEHSVLRDGVPSDHSDKFGVGNFYFKSRARRIAHFLHPPYW